MLFKIIEKTHQLEPVTSTWNPAELELEKFLITSESEVRILSESIFGEPLLLISNQVRTATKKRADILAIDRNGNGVVIELKRDKGRLGVETQATSVSVRLLWIQRKRFYQEVLFRLRD
jgi:RecB family endonuclease NucS